jgi:lysophospholipase L1-like esterase
VKRVFLLIAITAIWIACSGFGGHVGGFRRAGVYPRIVWPVGDSLTEGALETSPGVYVDSGGYRALLPNSYTTIERLRYSFVGTLSDSYGNNDGHPGWWTADLGNMLGPAGTGVSDILSHVPTWMASLGKIDIAIIFIGANSVKHCYATDTSVSDPGYPIFSYAVPPGADIGACWSGYIGANPTAGQIFAFQNDVAGAIHDTANEIASVVSAVATGCSGNCREIVVNLTPQVGYVNTLTLVNAQLAALMNGRSNVYYVTTPSITVADLGNDGTHLTADGYQKLETAIYAAYPQ